MRSRHMGVVTFTITVPGALSMGDPLHADLKAKMRQALEQENGGAVGEMLVDVPVARDPFGNPIVRGTSLFGALRAHLGTYDLAPQTMLTMREITSRGRRAQTSRPATLADLFCGSEPEEIGSSHGKPADTALRPSALRLVATDLVEGTPSDGRVRTAVSRRHGAAQAHKLFRRADLTEARIEAIVQVDLNVLRLGIQALCPGPTSAEEAFADLVGAVAQWQPRLGGQTGTGHGQGLLTELRWGSADPVALDVLLASDGVLHLLRTLADTTGRPTGLNVCLAPPPRERWRMEVRLRSDDPLLIAPTGSLHDGRANHAVSLDRVPGSSWRGLFRSRCEFILRSCDLAACESSDQTCGDCPTCQIFGWAPGPEHPPESVGCQGVLRFSDSAIAGQLQTFSHAPVDRFTGGASDQKLYTRAGWAPGSTMTLVIDQLSPSRPVPGWAAALIGLAVRDLTDGLLGVGNATTRGYGTVVLAEGEDLPIVPAEWLDGAHAAARVSAGSSSKGGAG